MDFKLFEYGIRNEAMREDWIKQRLLEIPEGLKILDAGAGDQHHKPLCSHLEYTAQDFGKYDGVGNGVGLQTSSYDYGKLDIISDIDSIPCPDENFDVVLCTEVLEHVPHPEKTVGELSRILKTEGKLILTAPFCSLTHFSPYHFFTGFNEYWYKTILPLYKIKIVSINSYGNYFEYLAQELHRIYVIANTYSSGGAMTSKEEIDSINTILRMLQRFDLNSDNKSSEILNYGFLVIGKKEN